MRYEMTKGEAEKILQFADELESYGMTFQGFCCGGRKSYGRKFLEAVRDRGGFVIREEPLTVEEHIIAVPDNGLCYCPDDSYTGMVKATVREMRNTSCPA